MIGIMRFLLIVVITMGINLNTAKAKEQAKQNRIATANKIASFLTGEMQQRAPVETGNLRRNSRAEASHEDVKSIIEAGTNVEYARIVHEGSAVRNIQGQPYIADSIQQNINAIQTLIGEGMEVK